MTSGSSLDWARNSLSIAWVESGVTTGRRDPDATGWLVVAGGGFRRSTGDASCSLRWGSIPLCDSSGFTRDLEGFAIGVKKFEFMLCPLRLTLESALALSAAGLVSYPAVTCGSAIKSDSLERIAGFLSLSLSLSLSLPRSVYLSLALSLFSRVT
jgi:hypothetical protein